MGQRESLPHSVAGISRPPRDGFTHMDAHALHEQVESIRARLYSIESELDQGRLPPEALEDFKAAVDDIRLRMWNIMAASKERDFHGALERFRIRRAVDITRAITEDLRSGEVGAHLAELSQLEESTAALRDAMEAVGALRGLPLIPRSKDPK